MRRGVLTLVCLALLFGLSSGQGAGAAPSKSLSTARGLCRSALGAKALNAAPGTIGALRKLIVGPTSVSIATSRFAHVFPGAKGAQIIGWCWTGEPGNYKLYAVAAAYKPVGVEGLRGKTYRMTPAPGPAPIP
jgi:hypothetical protein